MSQPPIGVFDSGVGGLTVFHALEQTVPGVSMLYLGDTARVPYGGRSPDTVVRYAREAAAFLIQRGISMLVVACNSASSVAIDVLSKELDVPVLGVIEPGAHRAVERSRTGRIGVIGTRATVWSGAYARAIHERNPDATVISQACPLFVPLAEEGWTDNEVAERVAETYLSPLREAEVDTLVLGCTHYPLLREVISRVMGRGVSLVDSAASVAEEVRSRLEAGPGTSRPSRVEHHFYVTDVPEPFQAVAERFLGRRIERLERVEIASE